MNIDELGELVAKTNIDARDKTTVLVPIPEHIAKNLLEFLRRVQSTGMEAVAWVEAYQYVQQHVPQPPAAPLK